MTKEIKYGKVLSTPRGPTDLVVDFQVEDWDQCKIGKIVTIPKRIGEEFVAVITSPHVHTEEYSDPALVRFYTQRGRDPSQVLPDIGSYMYLSARLIGTWDGQTLKFDGSVPRAGTDVMEISDSKLKKIFNFDGEGIFLGHMFFYPEIEIRLNKDIFMREHSAIFGVTRSGKSYTSGVVLEELIKIGSPVLILDPHGEYGTLSSPNDVLQETSKLKSIGLEPKPFEIQEFSPPMFVDASRGEREIAVNFSDLEPHEIIELAKFSGENQEALIFETCRDLRGTNYSIDEFLSRASGLNRQLNLTSMSIIEARIRVLERRGVFGTGVVPNELIRNGQVAVVNLSGLDLNTQQITVTAILRRLFRARTHGEIPAFSLFMEEAHRFASSSSDSIKQVSVFSAAGTQTKDVQMIEGSIASVSFELS